MKGKMQSLDLIDPTVTKATSRSIFENNSTEAEVPTGGRLWSYNPINQTMSYPYPLQYINRPFEVPAWCTAANNNGGENDAIASRVGDDRHGHRHPEITGSSCCQNMNQNGFLILFFEDKMKK